MKDKRPAWYSPAPYSVIQLKKQYTEKIEQGEEKLDELRAALDMSAPDWETKVREINNLSTSIAQYKEILSRLDHSQPILGVPINGQKAPINARN